ncbi:hypothetical protein TMES_11790 [Thalassospira mesophila]|uniref:Uncharacterized protein n=1 Tax=Thalassospira mesophila TaxID=1293891 RepID=A0A1Y2L0Z2_9PROT|nr:hypothetical protein TMES_11790 [Thalassospira mesophila]
MPQTPKNETGRGEPGSLFWGTDGLGETSQTHMQAFGVQIVVGDNDIRPWRNTREGRIAIDAAFDR